MPWFYLEIHEFWQDKDDLIFDKDTYLHNHPNEFWSLILKGGYVEIKRKNKDAILETCVRRPFNFAFVDKHCFHSVHSLLSTYCKTFIIKKVDRDENWGYLVDGKFVNHLDYRQQKNPVDNS